MYKHIRIIENRMVKKTVTGTFLILILFLFGQCYANQLDTNNKTVPGHIKGKKHQTREYYDKKVKKKINIITNEIIVKFTKEATLEDIKTINSAQGGTVLESLPAFKTYKLQVSAESDIDDILQSYRNSKIVKHAEPSYTTRTRLTPNDTELDNQWAIKNIELDKAWNYETGNKSITIAVLDTGVDCNHEELADNIITGYDFVNNDNDAMDDNGHGTAVAGIIGAKGNNNIGIAGVSWNSRIMPVKVIDNDGIGSYYDIARGILFTI